MKKTIFIGESEVWVEVNRGVMVVRGKKVALQIVKDLVVFIAKRIGVKKEINLRENLLVIEGIDEVIWDALDQELGKMDVITLSADNTNGEKMKVDKTIKCSDCGQEFVFTVGEQEFYESKGLTEPTYCLICRGKYEAREKQFGKYKRKD